MRSTKTVDGVTTQHIWDGANIVMDIVVDGDERTETVYIRGLQLIAAVETTILQDDSRTVRTVYYLHDGRGSVIQTVNSNGIVEQTYVYAAFGELLSEHDGDTNPFRHNAEYWDASTEMYYLRHRFYNPATGRFINEDPIRYGLNWYVFASNNPVMRIDPSGLADMYVQPARGLFVRSGPGTSYSRVGDGLTQGTRVTIIDTRQAQRPRADGFSWVQLSCGGWVADEFLGARSPVSQPTAQPAQAAPTQAAKGPQQLPDYTEQVMAVLRSNAAAAAAQGDCFVSNISWLIEQVGKDSIWDFKYEASWNILFPDLPYLGIYGEFIVNGVVMSSADLGNLNFGIVASALGIDEWIQIRGAGAAHILDNGFNVGYFLRNFGDSDRCRRFTDMGRDWFNQGII